MSALHILPTSTRIGEFSRSVISLQIRRFLSGSSIKGFNSSPDFDVSPDSLRILFGYLVDQGRGAEGDVRTECRSEGRRLSAGRVLSSGRFLHLKLIFRSRCPGRMAFPLSSWMIDEHQSAQDSLLQAKTLSRTWYVRSENLTYSTMKLLLFAPPLCRHGSMW